MVKSKSGKIGTSGNNFFCTFCKKKFGSRMAVMGHQRACLYARRGQKKREKQEKEVLIQDIKKALWEIKKDGDIEDLKKVLLEIQEGGIEKLNLESISLEELEKILREAPNLQASFQKVINKTYQELEKNMEKTFGKSWPKMLSQILFAFILVGAWEIHSSMDTKDHNQ